MTSFRDIDRVHIADMLSVGLIDDAVRARLPADLAERLGQIEDGVVDLDHLTKPRTSGGKTGDLAHFAL
jgi:hypothetical protein